MRKIRLAAAAAAAAAAALVLAASPAYAHGSGHGSGHGDAEPRGTIVDVAVAASDGGAPDADSTDHDILVQALLATGLDATLADPDGSFTVFAPNDRAFLRLVTDLTGSTPASEADALAAITSTFTVEQISDILLYHVVAGEELDPIDVILSGSLTMANGGEVRPRGITLRDETPSLGDPRLVVWALDIQASNGVIHTIDRVLVPAA